LEIQLIASPVFPAMFNKTIAIVTPWVGDFAGGAESLARGMARELNRRGVRTIVFTTCSLSPYDSWWEDKHAPGVYNLDGIEVRRFATEKAGALYHPIIEKLQQGVKLTTRDEEDFFEYGINSKALLKALAEVLDRDHEVLVLPYIHGLTYSAIRKFPGKISLIPCFHDESQFYWRATEDLLRDAKQIFYNSPEEKEMTIKQYGTSVGRKVVEGPVTGVGIELSANDQADSPPQQLPESYFVYAGRKDRGKNVPLLCEWFANYSEQSQNQSTLVFLGGGDKSIVPSAPCFQDLGFVSEAVKQQVIKGSKGIINLSRNESFSIVIMEGWLLGVPAIVSAQCAVMKGHVKRSNGGLFAENRDEFALCLKYLQDHPEVSEALGANGRRYVSANFSFDSVLAKYLGTLSDQGRSRARPHPC
jgi:glycosyltransferase involved in cell wall biosynthesis